MITQKLPEGDPQIVWHDGECFNFIMRHRCFTFYEGQEKLTFRFMLHNKTET
jgi:hypothetical protein